MERKGAIRKRQSKVSREGRNKEYEVIKLLKSDELIKSEFFIDKPEHILKDKSDLYIPYGNEKAMVDADICVVRKKDNKLVCVISVKKSFRERGGQTAYWAVKIKQFKKEYKYILATPDVDKELFNPNKPENKRKWRKILPYECDAVFIYSYKGKIYNEGNFYVGDDYLKEYIRNLKED
jgi:type II restriction enzyme